MKPGCDPYDVLYVSQTGLGRVALALVTLDGQLLDGARVTNNGYTRPLYHVRIALPPEHVERFMAVTRYTPQVPMRPAIDPLVEKGLMAWEEAGGDTMDPLGFNDYNP